MKTSKVATAFCLLSLTASIYHGQILEHVAGNHTQGYGGDNGLALNAQLVPTGVVLDAMGNMYIADESASVVRRVDAMSQVITTVAGTGTAGYNGDSIPAGSAQLNHPLYLCFDKLGNLYISDSQNHRVRKIKAQGGQITPSCVITTVAGDGTYSLVASTAGDGGPAVNGQLNHPVGVAVDGAGNLFIGDTGNHALRKVDTSGIITTISGDPNHYLSGHTGDGLQAKYALLFSPHGLAFDAAGDLYFADTGNNRVRKITAQGGQITKTCIINAFAGPANGTLSGFSGDQGLATSARLQLPFAVAVDGGGNVYISDQTNDRIRKVDTAGIITTIAGTGNDLPYNWGSGGVSPTTANLNHLHQLALDTCPNSPNLYFADQSNFVIGRVTFGTPPVFNPSIISANPICAGKNIEATGQYSGLVAPNGFSWQLQSSTSSGVPTGAYDSGVLTFSGAPSGVFSFPNTSNLPCNQYYLITFTVKSCLSPVPAKVTKVIYLICNPSLVITGNTTVCYGSPTTLCANHPNNSQYTVEWIYHTGTVVHDVDAQCITVSPTTNTTYNVSVTDNATGCKSIKSVPVTVVKTNSDFTYQTNYQSPNPYFTVTATPVAPYTNSIAGFGHLWIIEQLDSLGNPIAGTATNTGNQGNPTCWWPYPAAITFNGFDGTKSSGINNVTCPTPAPGRFLNGATYRITHGIWNSYCPWSQTSHTFSVTGNKGTGKFTTVERKSNTHVPDFHYLKPRER